MTGWSPPTISRQWLIGIGTVYALLLAYVVLVLGELLVGLVPAFAFLSLYFAWRFLLAVEAIADALQRIAREREDDE